MSGRNGDRVRRQQHAASSALRGGGRSRPDDIAPDDFRENPAFPQEYQPRDRTRSYSEAQINDIAANPVPERPGAVFDAPNRCADCRARWPVESGNGRVLAIRRAYQGGMVPADRYAAWLKRMGFEMTAWISWC